ncbi:MAG: hypothetical protein LIO87_06220 [Eubacterium sp.]|nr:hypothetical protein [Eubacterium sp.]
MAVLIFVKLSKIRSEVISIKSYIIFILGIIIVFLLCINLNTDENTETKIDLTLANVYVKTDEEAAPLTAIYSESLQGIETTAEIVFMKNTDPLPYNFMVKCIAEDKTPYIVIEEGQQIFDLSHIEEIAESIGYFNTDAYIELYPLYVTPNFNSAAYRQFYKNAAEIIREKAPKSKIVWAVAPELIYNETDFLPPEQSFDLMGISLLCGLNGENTLPLIYDKLEYISFAYSKPVIISRFSAADYCEITHSYYKNEKRKYISALSEIKALYPNIIGFIVYESNNYEFEGYNNRLLISNDDEALRELIAVIREFENDKGNEKKLPVCGAIISGSAYLNEEDYNRFFSAPYTAVSLNNKKYINISKALKTEVSEKNKSVIICEDML